MSLNRKHLNRPHYFFSGFDDFFSTPFMTDVAVTPFLTNFERPAGTMVLRRTSPSYEVTENDKEFQLSIDVPGIKAPDLHVELEQGGRVLKVSGGRKIRQSLPDGSITSSDSKFEKMFTMDRNVDTSQITANLSDGVLVVTAPKDPKHTEVRKIAIVEGPPVAFIKEQGEVPTNVPPTAEPAKL
jgi:HSP20 family protein